MLFRNVPQVVKVQLSGCDSVLFYFRMPNHTSTTPVLASPKRPLLKTGWESHHLLNNYLTIVYKIYNFLCITF